MLYACLLYVCVCVLYIYKLCMFLYIYIVLKFPPPQTLQICTDSWTLTDQSLGCTHLDITCLELILPRMKPQKSKWVEHLRRKVVGVLQTPKHSASCISQGGWLPAVSAPQTGPWGSSSGHFSVPTCLMLSSVPFKVQHMWFEWHIYWNILKNIYYKHILK